MPCTDKSHTVSSEVRRQIRCLFKLFAAHPAGQCAVLFPPQSCGGQRGRCRCRTVQRALIIVIPAVTWGGCWEPAEGLLVVSGCIFLFVDDEAMA